MAGPRYSLALNAGEIEDICAEAIGHDGDFSQTAAMSLEQLLSPLEIERGHPAEASTPGFRALTVGEIDNEPTEVGFFGSINPFEPTEKCVSPSSSELDPYFPSIWGDEGEKHISMVDYRVFNHDHDGAETTDFNEDKCNPNSDGEPQQRESVNAVRVVGLRGPLIMSGWGFGVDDFPVPGAGPVMPEKAKFDPDLRDMRSTWKTGPVHLMWDDERQVWAGSHRIVCGVLINSDEDADPGDEVGITAPTSICTPTTFKIRLLRNTGLAEDGEGVYGDGSLSDVFGETVTVTNRDPSLVQQFYENSIFVIAIKLNYEWLPIWVGCPMWSSCGCTKIVGAESHQPEPPSCLTFAECDQDRMDEEIAYNCTEPANFEHGDDHELPRKDLEE